MYSRPTYCNCLSNTPICPTCFGIISSCDTEVRPASACFVVRRIGQPPGCRLPTDRRAQPPPAACTTASRPLPPTATLALLKPGATRAAHRLALPLAQPCMGSFTIGTAVAAADITNESDMDVGRHVEELRQRMKPVAAAQDIGRTIASEVWRDPETSTPGPKRSNATSGQGGARCRFPSPFPLHGPLQTSIAAANAAITAAADSAGIALPQQRSATQSPHRKHLRSIFQQHDPQL